MKTILFATAALFAVNAVPALAGEGNGDPFAFHANGITTQLRAGTAGSMQNPSIIRSIAGSRSRSG